MSEQTDLARRVANTMECGMPTAAQLLRDLANYSDNLLAALLHIEGVAMVDEPRDLPGIAQTARAAIAATNEPQAVAADLAYNRMKTTGALQRREADRALAEQVKWEAP